MRYVKIKNKQDKSDWHLWFAWKPVVVRIYPDGNQEIAFFEYVLRKFILDPGKPGIGVNPFWKPVYKARPKSKFVSPKRWELDTTTPNLTAQVIELGPKVGDLFGRDQTFEEWEEAEKDIEDGGTGLNMTGEGLDHQTRIISREEAEEHWKNKYPESCEFENEDGSCEDEKLAKEAKERYNHPVEVNWRKKHGKTIM